MAAVQLLASALARTPFALDGESAAPNSTGVAVISLVSIVFGYVLLFCLWHFVFRERARERRKKDRSER
ncbi:MAG: hypothetical protein ACYDC2_04075 [Solirubrobacteraceae bacterium]